MQYGALLSTENILERIWSGEEDDIDWEYALKIMCLVSWRCGGFSPKTYEYHKMEFLNLFGFDKLKYLLQLEENKLIGLQGSVRNVMHKNPIEKSSLDTTASNTVKES